jgi:hypothetical protein
MENKSPSHRGSGRRDRGEAAEFQTLQELAWGGPVGVREQILHRPVGPKLGLVVEFGAPGHAATGGSALSGEGEG